LELDIPLGSIYQWSGSIASIPTGWGLCDGTNGTPDLRDRFLVGAGGALNPDDTGGASQHQHTLTTDGHTHGITGGPGLAIAGGAFRNLTTSATDTSTSANASSLPTYLAFAYVMKVICYYDCYPSPHDHSLVRIYRHHPSKLGPL